MGAYSKGGSKIFLVVGHVPVQSFLLATYFFAAAHTSNRMFLKGQDNSRQLIAAFLSCISH